MIEIKVPEFGESIQEVQIGSWYKQVGEWIDKDEDLVELESEKASQALPSPEAGRIESIQHENGSFVNVGDVIATIDPSTEKPAIETASSQSTNGSAAQAAGETAEQGSGSLSAGGPWSLGGADFACWR